MIVWARPLAEERIATETLERESAYAGVRQTDSRGRQVDRRGFREAKEAVENLHRFQTNMHSRHGRYGESVADIEHAALFPEDVEGAQTTVFEDGQSFMTWSETPSGFVFAMSGRPDDETGWEYGGYEMPHAPGPGPDWYHGHGDRHPDWV